MLDFESPNPASKPERNLRCQQKSRAITSPTPATTVATNKQSRALNSCHSTPMVSAAFNASSHWMIWITNCYFQGVYPLLINVARFTVSPRIQPMLPASLPLGEATKEQECENLTFAPEAVASIDVRYWPNEFAQPDQLSPIQWREILRVMTVSQHPVLEFTHTHPSFLMPQPRHRTPVMHQHDVTERPDQLSLRNKKRPPSVNWTAQGRLRRGTRSGRRNGVWLRHALRGLLCLFFSMLTQLINPKGRNFIAPLVDSLHRDIAYLSDILHGAKLFNCVIKSHGFI